MLKFLGLIILLAPLAGAVVAGSHRLRDRSHFAVIAGVAVAFLASLGVLFQIPGVEGAGQGPEPAAHESTPAVPAGQVPGEHGASASGDDATAVWDESADAYAQVSASVPVYDWISRGTAGGTERSWFSVEFLFDPLTALMLCTVTGIALMIVCYSRDYMRHHDHPERGYERFFAYMGLFVFSMCALVLGGNFLLLYLGWEAVGLCSYLLIGFYYEKPSAAEAMKKAFLVNRVGDFGFGLGILLIYLTFGTLQYEEVFGMATSGLGPDGAAIEGWRYTAIALLLFCGACGKSAQLPLHVWLPDAMEGPSPVSALIHAATMVTAGVYMIARCGAIFVHSPAAMTVVAIVGGLTSLFAATIALAQYDMKRILAYSTISQLGYMVLAMGVYAAGSGIFHLFTHAFFKALLFLAAGSVMHAMGGVIDVRRFGGLRKVLPYTFWLMVIGSAALAGVPFFSGFFSKDEIIHHALNANGVLGLMALFTAMFTAFYTSRMVFLAFFGLERTPEGAHPHESGSWMIRPMAVLAVGAVIAGWFGGGIHRFLDPVFESTFARAAAHGQEGGYALMVISGVLAVASIGAAYFVYVKNPWVAQTARATFPRIYTTLLNKYYVDELYARVIIEPARRLGRWCVNSDNFFVDGLVWFVSAVPRGVAHAVRGLQAGALQGYALTMALGLAILAVYALW